MLAIREGCDSDSSIVLRPVVSKSVVKGTVALAVISVFLEITPGNLSRYAIFIGIWYAFVGYYVASKRSARYTIDEEGILIEPFLRAAKRIRYSEVVDLSISQGLLAKRFDCGTLFVSVKGRRASATLFGGGAAEALRDVRRPGSVADEIMSRVSPYSF